MLSILLAQALNVSIVAGGISTISAQDAYSISPTASIETYADLADTSQYDYVPNLSIAIDLSALPEETIDIFDPTTFKTIEFKIGVIQPIPNIFPKIYGRYGFSTRLPGDKDPRVKVAQYFSLGVRFATSDSSSYIEVGGGPDQRLEKDGYYTGCGHISGLLKLHSLSKNIKLSLKGDAILGLNSSLVRVGIVIGI